MYHYYQIEGGEETWKPVQVDFLSKVIAGKSPMFVTVLAGDKLTTKDTPREEKLALKYLGPIYIDFDHKTDLQYCIDDLKSFIKALEKLDVPLSQIRFFATGGKGFHVEMPLEMFLIKVPKAGVQYLPLIAKQIALHFAEDTMDWRVYSIGMGRMWRQPNVLRPNGRYKVPLTLDQVRALTVESTLELTSAPQPEVQTDPPEPHVELAVLFDKHSQEITDRLKAVKKRKPVASEAFKRGFPSVELLMQNKGVRAGAGFNQIAMQLAVYAREAGLDEDTLVSKCDGLITHHESDGNRYHTPERRAAELRRMYQVVGDDPCYEYAAPAMRKLMTHDAPDLDGVMVDAAEIQDAVENPEPVADGDEQSVDEYADVAHPVKFTKYGMYGWADGNSVRISAVSFDGVRVLRSMDSNKISCVEAEVLVNGKPSGRQVIELETFHTAAGLNKFLSRYGHAFQGSETQAKAAYMRLIEKGRKAGSEVYVHEREGLGLINIPHHPDERLREPFLIWADAHQVVLEPKASEAGVTINFQGSPDPRGVFRTDLTDAPGLVDWLKEDGNKEILRNLLSNIFKCQKPDFIGNYIGWLTACFYKSIFQKLYNQFPILHINGFAGSGKSAMTKAFTHLFYYNQEPKILSPGSTVFALSQGASGSDSIPLVVDEYKPHEMAPGMHDRLKLMFRDAYNARDIQRGGGNRDNDNFKALSTTSLSAPIIFVAEAIEEESALMERVVLLTLSPPPSIVAHRWAARFLELQPHAKYLAVIGKYIASKLVMTGYTTDQLASEFGPIYSEARDTLMLRQEDLDRNLDLSKIREKQAARERSVYNFSVAKFGLIKFKEIVDSVFGPEEFADDFADFFQHTYTRLKDLAASTMPEYLKVLNTIVDLSYLDPMLTHAVRYGEEYGFANMGGKDTLEISARACYARYRQYCRLTNTKPLYSGEASFVHSLKNAAALLEVGVGQAVAAPGGVHIFDLDELVRLGLTEFKPERRKRP